MIDWDPAKRKKNLKDHGIDLAAIGSVFDHPMATVEDKRAAYGESRFQSLGWLGDRVVFVVWTEREDRTRVISCRYGDKDETRTYFRTLGLE
jgi:uncharacterized protein